MRTEKEKEEESKVKAVDNVAGRWLLKTKKTLIAPHELRMNVPWYRIFFIRCGVSQRPNGADDHYLTLALQQLDWERSLCNSLVSQRRAEAILHLLYDDSII